MSGFIAAISDRKFSLPMYDWYMHDPMPSIDEWLNTIQDKGSLRARLRLAPMVASSLMDLHDRPWALFYKDRAYLKVASIRSGSDIQFFAEQRLHKSRVSSIDDNTVSTEDMMLRLAIFLLELCFGRPFASHEYRNEFVGRDDKPHNRSGK